MDLKHLTSKALFSEMKVEREIEKKNYLKILEYLKEIDSRAIYVDLGYLSLFSYMTQELGYSKDEAYLRINALRIMAKIPSVKEELAKNNFSLGTLDFASRIEPLLSGKNNDEKLKNALEIVHGKSKNEAYLAYQKLKDESERKKEPVEMHRKIFIKLSSDEYKNLTELEKLKRKEARDFLVEKVYEERRKLQVEPKNIDHAKSRHIPESLKRAIMIRAKFMCEAKNCTQNKNLEFAHKLAYSKGGGHTFDNIRLLCRAHHKRETVLEFGRID